MINTLCPWCFNSTSGFLHLFTAPKKLKPGGIESVAAISMGHGAPVPLPVVRTCRHRLGIGIALCGRLHLATLDLDHSAEVLRVGGVLATRLGHVSLLLLGLSSGQKHLDGGLGCGSFCLWLGGWRWTPLWRYSSSTRGNSHSAHPCHAGPLQLWHGASLQRVPTAMARLLDTAILTGQLIHLRRWEINFYNEECWEAARTALWAGADIQILWRIFWVKTFLFDKPCFWSPSWRIGSRNLDDRLGIFMFDRPHGPGGFLHPLGFPLPDALPWGLTFGCSLKRNVHGSAKNSQMPS